MHLANYRRCLLRLIRRVILWMKERQENILICVWGRNVSIISRGTLSIDHFFNQYYIYCRADSVYQSIQIPDELKKMVEKGNVSIKPNIEVYANIGKFHFVHFLLIVTILRSSNFNSFTSLHPSSLLVIHCCRDCLCRVQWPWWDKKRSSSPLSINRY